MTEGDRQRLGAPVSAEHGAQRMAAGTSPGHLDLDAVEHDNHESAMLGPNAARWAQSLLEVARFELARADDKASTLFRFYGVVAALSIGLLAGNGWSPTDLEVAAQALFWAGCAALLASGVFLGMTLYPRDVRGTPRNRLLYFGHVIAYRSVPELTAALCGVEEDSENRLVEQLLAVSRLVHSKYALTRKALLALGAGTALSLAAVIVDSIVKNAKS